MFRGKKHILIIGGGLSGCLMAYRLRKLYPELRVQIWEKSLQLAGNHTWCFHSTDVTSSWIYEIVSSSWQNYDVKFPVLTRTLSGSYHAIRSEDLKRIVEHVIPKSDIHLGQSIVRDSAYSKDEHSVSIANLKVRFPDAEIIWASGWQPSSHSACGFQKFIGLDIELTNDHGMTRPMLMDATVSQGDGYTFMYLLPWSDKKVLAELTFYSDNNFLNDEKIEADILRYINNKNWVIKSIVRKEKGALPIPFFSSVAPDSLNSIGAFSQSFHPTTGYSLPFLINQIDSMIFPDISPKRVKRIYFILNRMLFLACHPSKRYDIFEVFYKRGEGLIKRFYAGETSFLDSCRIFFRKPPSTIFEALKCFCLRKSNT